MRRGAVSREVQNDEGCSFTSSGVQSHVPEVQSRVKNGENARENAPDPVIEPVIDPVNEPGEGARENPASHQRTNATRIPIDFALTGATREWVIREGLTTQQIAYELEKFVDYWSAESGSRARKLDWQAAFRTWIRRHLEDGPSRASPRVSPKPDLDEIPDDGGLAAWRAQQQRNGRQ